MTGKAAKIRLLSLIAIMYLTSIVVADGL